MSISVADCLKLPALRDASLAAGASGIDRPVSSISVLEYPDVSVINDNLVVGNELVLSALAVICDDVEMQCELVRHMHSLGVAGLVLYYVGVYIKKIDKRLLLLADNLGFPVIVMPHGRMDFRYSDLITEVMERVITDQKQEKYFSPEIVRQISQLPEHKRTVSSVLRLLSDRIRCSLLLSDRYLVQKSVAAWPVSNQWDYQQILDTFKDTSALADSPVEMMCNREVFVWSFPVLAKKHIEFYLFVLDENGTVDRESIHQVVEVIELFLNVWNSDTNYEGTDALIKAVLNDRPDEMRNITAKMNIDVSSIHNIWILNLTNVDGNEMDRNQRLNCLVRLNRFLKEHHKIAIVDYYSHYLVAMTDDNIFDEKEYNLAVEYAEILKHRGINIQGAVCQGIMDTTQARDAYILSDENINVACRIYTAKSIFTLGEIRFSKWCSQEVTKGENHILGITKCLEKLQLLPDYNELIQTLAVYLLDSDSNTQKTGNLMFLHKNTIKYRLNKIRTALNCELSQMPEAVELYQAVGILRMLKQSEN